MQTLSRIRMLILIQLGILAVMISAEMADLFPLQGELAAAQASLVSEFMFGDAVIIVIGVLSIAAMVGVWQGRNWGRLLHTLCFALLMLPTQAQVLHPMVGFLDGLCQLSEGALLALLWIPAWQQGGPSPQAGSLS